MGTLSIINYSSYAISVTITAGSTITVESIGAGATKSFGGNCYGNLNILVEHTQDSATLSFYYAISYF
ncbi:MAG: hypothetical protein LBD75_08130 [Candidatus Peribacteria bacterium]|nr:hypothetical protein [Candidatus Peribacteria bacterium]